MAAAQDRQASESLPHQTLIQQIDAYNRAHWFERLTINAAIALIGTHIDDLYPTIVILPSVFEPQQYYVSLTIHEVERKSWISMQYRYFDE